MSQRPQHDSANIEDGLDDVMSIFAVPGQA
jgi:hypothetical protein